MQMCIVISRMRKNKKKLKSILHFTTFTSGGLTQHCLSRERLYRFDVSFNMSVSIEEIKKKMNKMTPRMRFMSISILKNFDVVVLVAKRVFVGIEFPSII